MHYPINQLVRNIRSEWMLVLLATLMLGIFFRVTHISQKVYWHDEVFTPLRASGYVEEEILEQAFSGLPIVSSHLLQYRNSLPIAVGKKPGTR